MNLLIIEDEAPAARRLQGMILKICDTCNIVGIIQSVKEGLQWFNQNPAPDLILSDIQLSDDLSFEIFRKLNIQIPVIFTTAFDEYAINAFRFYSIDYLLKPIKEEELARSIDKYLKIAQKPDISIDFNALVKKLAIKDYRSRFLVYAGDSIIPVCSSEVSFIFSEEGLTTLHTQNGRKYTINESLDQLNEELNPKNFFRVNRQYIISSGAILKMHKYFNQKLKVVLKNAEDREVIVSKLKATEFKNWLNQ